MKSTSIVWKDLFLFGVYTCFFHMPLLFWFLQWFFKYMFRSLRKFGDVLKKSSKV